MSEVVKDEIVEVATEDEIREAFPELKPLARTVIAKVCVSTLSYPISLVKTLIELGYEPFPLRRLKFFILFGHANYYLPNGIKYMWNLYKKYGFKALYTGLDAAICSTVTYTIVYTVTINYFDANYPDLGGEPLNLEKDEHEHELTTHQNARVKIRDTIRDSISRFIATFVSRPFTVLTVQKIVGFVILKQPSVGFFPTLYKIGDSDGPGGLFSGFIPQFLADFLAILSIQAFRFGIELGLRYFVERKVKDEDLKKDIIKKTLQVSKILVPLTIGSLGFIYPFRVTSTVMAANVNSQSSEILQFMPRFSHWINAYHILKPEFATRGRLYWRDAKDQFRIRADQQAYKISSFVNRLSDKYTRKFKAID